MRRRTLVFGAMVALLLGLGTGTAFAFFTSHGTGTGSGKTGSPTSVHVIQATGTVSSELIPGGYADLIVALNNPNSSSLTLTSIAQSGPVTVVGNASCTSDSGSEPDLTPGNSGVSAPTLSGLSVPVSSGSDVVLHIAGGAYMSTSSASACQGASFQIPVTVTVTEP